MANPSVAELTPILAEARLQASEVPGADRAYDSAQGAIATQRAVANEIIEDIRADLISSLRRLEAPSQRRVMRSYGLIFATLPGEPDETDPVATPETSPDATPPKGPAPSPTA